MSDDPYHIPSSELGVVRVFTTDLEPEGAAAITASNVHKLLGADVTLDPEKVEVFPAKVISALGLSAYLAEGHGISAEHLSGKRAALDALTGLIVVLPSSAFQGKSQVLDPNPSLRFVGAFSEPAKAPPAPMAKPESADGQLTPPDTGFDPAHLRQRNGSWIIALGALIIAATLVLFAVF